MVFRFGHVLNILKSMPKQVIFVLGAPGAGKGTQCKKITEKFGYVHLSAGDLLREERARPESKYGELIEKYIREGSIVPVEITCTLLENAMKKSGQNRFLIDGFPRNKDNLDGWNRQLEGKTKVLFVLFIKCPAELCVERCLSRGQAGSGRSDDNIESLNKRFRTYITETQPIIDYYQKLHLVKTVDGTRSPDDVFSEIENIFREYKGAGDF